MNADEQRPPVVPTRPPATLGFLAHHTQTVDALLWLRETCAATTGFSHHLLTNAALAIPGAHQRLMPDATLLLAKGERHASRILRHACG